MKFLKPFILMIKWKNIFYLNKIYNKSVFKFNIFVSIRRMINNNYDKKNLILYLNIIYHS